MNKGKKTETAPIKWRKAMMLLDAMRDKRNDNTRMMLACGFFMGLRISDILSLSWGQIMKDEFVIKELKTGKSRKIGLDPKFIELRDQILNNKFNFREPPNPKQLIFVNQRRDGDKSKPISIVSANKRIKKAFEEYDIQSKNPSSHTLRKTFGLRIYENFNRCEDALILLAEIFNHQDTSITRKYIGVTQRRISNAYLTLSSGKPDIK